MDRFQIVSEDVAKLAPNWEDYDYGYDWDDWGDYLIDSKTGEIIYKDGGEPEDMTLGRNLSFFVELANRAANGD
jgi:hypothetical protein